MSDARQTHPTTRVQNAPDYDPRRALARLALIEQEVTLDSAVREHQEILARQPQPPEAGDPWEGPRARAERVTSRAEDLVRQLAPLVGDRETVIDEQGFLPAQRREKHLGEFTAKFNAEVSRLHERLPALRADLKAAGGSDKRAAIREKLHKGTARLAYLEAVPPFTASDMCPECPTPMDWHDTAVTFCLESGAILSEPCDAWPAWRERREIGRQRVMEVLRRAQERKEKPPSAMSAPRLLAIIDAGTWVEEAIAQLTAVQAEHPKAQVRRGKRNCWEIWSAPTLS